MHYPNAGNTEKKKNYFYTYSKCDRLNVIIGRYDGNRAFRNIDILKEKCNIV